MHLDHLTFAAGPGGLEAEVARLSERLGEKFRDGGIHPSFGTRNHILPLADDRYLEVVAVLDHPVAEKELYGKAVRARTEAGGGWLGSVIAVDDLAPYAARLGLTPTPGARHFPDGRLLEWHQIGFSGLVADPQLPYFLHWDSDPDVLPSALNGDIKLHKIEISGSRQRIEEWVGVSLDDGFDGVELEFTAPNGQPGVAAVTFETPKLGLVRI